MSSVINGLNNSNKLSTPDKRSKSENKYNIRWDEDYQNVASATEMTGLIPSAARTDEEIEAYYDLIPFSYYDNIPGKSED
jgi:hypothetical protein